MLLTYMPKIFEVEMLTDFLRSREAVKNFLQLHKAWLETSLTMKIILSTKKMFLAKIGKTTPLKHSNRIILLEAYKPPLR